MVDGVKGDWIDGVKVIPLRRIPDERGSIMKMISKDDEHYVGFGECYYSCIFPGVVKAWHKHKEMILNYTVVSGNVKLVLFNEKDNNIMEIFLGEDNYCLVQIPPGIFNGFKSIGNQKAIISNFASIVHDPEEQERLPPDTDKIPYDWGIKHE